MPTVFDCQIDGESGAFNEISAVIERISRFNETQWGDGVDIQLWPGTRPWSSRETFAGFRTLPTTAAPLRVYAALGYGPRTKYIGDPSRVVQQAARWISRIPNVHWGQTHGVGHGWEYGGTEHPFKLDFEGPSINADGNIIDSIFCRIEDPEQNSGLFSTQWNGADTHSPVTLTTRNCMLYFTGNCDKFEDSNAALSLGTVKNANLATMRFRLHDIGFHCDARPHATKPNRRVHQGIKYFNKTNSGVLELDIRNCRLTGDDVVQLINEGQFGVYDYASSGYCAGDAQLSPPLPNAETCIEDIDIYDECVNPDHGDFTIRAGARTRDSGSPVTPYDMTGELRKCKTHGPIDAASTSPGALPTSN